MTGPELVQAYNAMAGTLGKKPIKKFETKVDGARRCAEFDVLINSAKPKKASNGNGSKPRGEDVSITRVEANPKKAGSKSAKRYEEMEKYVKSHPGCKLSEVIKETSYRKADYKWDSAHGNVEGK
jgi:hypothetical protein